VHSLYLEGAHWDKQGQCLARSHPGVLIEELPMMLIVPIEVHRLKLQVSNASRPMLNIIL
jgi:dynein heavy chain